MVTVILTTRVVTVTVTNASGCSDVATENSKSCTGVFTGGD